MKKSETIVPPFAKADGKPKQKTLQERWNEEAAAIDEALRYREENRQKTL
jgi:hypothetical protein